jgi:hypothetical protein
MKRTKTIGVRIPLKDAELLKKICLVRGEDMSDFIRHAIYVKLAHLGFLDNERTKILIGKV